MRCRALATDYDGTIATHGAVDDATLLALDRFRASGRLLILVTGRRVEDLHSVFAHVDHFDLVVAENGALLYWPLHGRERILAEAANAQLVKMLIDGGVTPVEVGRVIVATFEPYEVTVLDAIKTLGLELQVIFNKGAVMVLPSGVNKATGLQAAVVELGIDVASVVGVGDAENDHAFFRVCGFSAAVANALPALQKHADLVTTKTHGAGVAELIELILADRLPAPRTAPAP